MSRSRKNKDRPTAFQRTVERIQTLESDISHWKSAIAGGLPIEKHRVLWCRIEDAKNELQRLRWKRRKLGKRCEPADELPLCDAKGRKK